jgi:hypothetical protein
VSIVEFFNPEDPKHCQAYRSLIENGTWPTWFLDTVPQEGKDNIPPGWPSLIQAKMADLWSRMKVRESGGDQ